MGFFGILLLYNRHKCAQQNAHNKHKYYGKRKLYEWIGEMAGSTLLLLLLLTSFVCESFGLYLFCLHRLFQYYMDHGSYISWFTRR